MTWLIAGMLFMGYLVAALFFLRFWRSTRDGLFAAFAAAFYLLAIQRLILTLYAQQGELVVSYLVRLAAFVIILVAIIGKNLAPRRPVP